MKVILKDDVQGLGKKDDMVNAKNGYAKNYLFPKGLAIEANLSNLNDVKQKNKASKAKKDSEIQEAKALKEQFKKYEITIKSKAGEGNKLFGSVTNKDIAEKLLEVYKVKVDKKKVLMNEGIKSLGDVTVDIKLYPKIIAKLKVKIERE
ncbi:MAG: 50S ribosomal protein L9 [Clostridiales bacterium]